MKKTAVVCGGLGSCESQAVDARRRCWLEAEERERAGTTTAAVQESVVERKAETAAAVEAVSWDDGEDEEEPKGCGRQTGQVVALSACTSSSSRLRRTAESGARRAGNGRECDGGILGGGPHTTTSSSSWMEGENSPPRSASLRSPTPSINNHHAIVSRVRANHSDAYTSRRS